MEAIASLRARPLGPSARRTLLVLLGAGLFMRLVWAFQTAGLPFDMKSLEQVANALLDRPLHLYGDVNPQGEYHWPDPPG